MVIGAIIQIRNTREKVLGYNKVPVIRFQKKLSKISNSHILWH